MKTFLAVYTGLADAMAAWNKLPDSERLARQTRGIAAWKDWAQQNAAAIVETGGPLGRTKAVTTRGMADVRNNLAAFTIVRAESQEAAAELFVNHPHFTIFPGEAVEIMEILPIPPDSDRHA